VTYIGLLIIFRLINRILEFTHVLINLFDDVIASFFLERVCIEVLQVVLLISFKLYCCIGGAVILALSLSTPMIRGLILLPVWRLCFYVPSPSSAPSCLVMW